MTTPTKPVATWRKLLAAVLDFFTIFLLAGYSVASFTGKATEGGFDLQGLPAFLVIALVVVYFLVFTGYLGGTPWQRLLGTRTPAPDEGAAGSISVESSSSQAKHGLFDSLRRLAAKLGILRYGEKSYTYTSGRDRPAESLMKDVYSAERDLTTAADIRKVLERAKAGTEKPSD